MKRVLEIMLDFIMRGIIGTCLICMINTLTGAYGIDMAVGINEVTLLIAGLLGLPGVIFLYGIVLLC